MLDKKRFLQVVGISLGIYIATNLFDPFGLKSATEQQSAKILNLFYSKLYPLETDKTVTLIIDDQTLVELGEQYPVNLSTFSAILYMLPSLKSRAVFLDILFKDKDSVELQEFENTVSWLNDSGVYLFLIDPVGQSTDTDQFIRAMAAKYQHVKLVDAQWDVHHLNISYPSYQRFNSKNLTPAWAICDALVVTKEECSESLGSDIEVWWKTSQDKSIWQAISITFQTVLANLKGDLDSNSISWTTDIVLTQYAMGDVLLGNLSTQQWKAFDGRVVIVGQALQGLNDSLRTAVSSSVPGPLYHAMAIENLLSGINHKRINSFVMTGIETVFVAIVLLINIWLEKCVRKLGGEQKQVLLITNGTFLELILVVASVLTSILVVFVLGAVLLSSGMGHSVDIISVVGATELAKLIQDRIAQHHVIGDKGGIL